MESERFTVSGDSVRMAAARCATEAFANQLALNERNTLRLTLLVEETLGMVKAMVDDFHGEMWFEGEDAACGIHLLAEARMDADKKSELLSVSTTGKNAAAKGFMAMLGEVISSAAHNFGKALDLYGAETAKYGIVHAGGIGMASADGMMPLWTLQTYRSDLQKQSDADAAAEQALNDLEKSIVARLADDVVVGVRNNSIELVISKDFNR